jgi:hypothetical protein
MFTIWAKYLCERERESERERERKRERERVMRGKYVYNYGLKYVNCN